MDELPPLSDIIAAARTNCMELPSLSEIFAAKSFDDGDCGDVSDFGDDSEFSDDSDSGYWGDDDIDPATSYNGLDELTLSRLASFPNVIGYGLEK